MNNIPLFFKNLSNGQLKLKSTLCWNEPFVVWIHHVSFDWVYLISDMNLKTIKFPQIILSTYNNFHLGKEWLFKKE